MYRKLQNTWTFREDFSEEINIIFNIGKKTSNSCTREGAPWHFYHFYQGFLILLYCYLHKNNLLGKQINFYMMSTCKIGPLTPILEGEIPNLKVYDYELDFKNRNKQINTLTLSEHWEKYGYNIPIPHKPHSAEIIKVWNERPTAIKGNNIKNNIPKILFIKRGVLREKKYREHNIVGNLENGATRRSIINNEEIENKLREEGYDVKSEMFEHKTFREQQKSLENIDILIAQHGASLAHLYDVKRKIIVIELPPILITAYEQICKLKQFKYIQGDNLQKNHDKNHVEIDVDALALVIKNAL
jgi:hypothetical protein